MKRNILKKSICAALAAITAVLSSGCGNVEQGSSGEASTQAMTDAKTATAEDRADDELGTTEINGDFTSAYMQYSTDLLKASCMEDLKAGRNVMVSPESVAYALALVENGADGETLAQMESLLGGISIGEQNKELGAVITKTQASEDVKFNIADSVWIKEGKVTLAQEYSDNVRECLKAEVFSDPFDGGAAGRINGWVKDNTDGMIPEIISPDAINELTRAVLVNAICFEAEWSYKYDDGDAAEDCDFTSADGKTQKCTMLSSIEHSYIKGDDVKGFLKMYEGGEYAFMALLPDEGITTADFVEDLDGEKLEELWSSRKSMDVIVNMPEFTGDYGITLNEPLKSLGMTDAFDDGKADFSKLAESDEQLYISDIFHKTHIEVDRKGTKAAAATAVTMQTNGVEAVPSERVILDRPFVYMIVDTENGMPIFMGVVNSIE